MSNRLSFDAGAVGSEARRFYASVRSAIELLIEVAEETAASI
jgi:hypothetical protein